MSVVSFHHWNELEWWHRAGYRTRDEAWDDFSRSQRLFAPEAFRNAAAVQDDVRRINTAARAAERTTS